MRIQSNTLATNATNVLAAREVSLGKSLEKLSSGYRINRAADDAAGLVISQKLRSEISGLRTAARNVQDAISMMQIADSTYASVGDAFQRMHDLQLQYASVDASDTTARDAIADEWTLLRTGAAQTVADATWGDDNFLVGLFDRTFQVGSTATDRIQFAILNDVSLDTISHAAALLAPDATSLAIDDTLDYTAYGGTGSADMLAGTKNGIATISAARAWFGAAQNRLESIKTSLENATENLTASESRIRDTDMAAEMVTFTRHQILREAGTAMLAQANQLPRTVLSLLQ